VTKLIARSAVEPARGVALICGPEIMMRFAIAGCRDFGFDETSIYLSMERNMKCAVGHCGHCQFGATFVCKDGPVLRYDRVRSIFGLREI
jgi:NAD(P)H-flavin reductase